MFSKSSSRSKSARHRLGASVHVIPRPAGPQTSRSFKCGQVTSPQLAVPSQVPRGHLVSVKSLSVLISTSAFAVGSLSVAFFLMTQALPRRQAGCLLQSPPLAHHSQKWCIGYHVVYTRVSTIFHCVETAICWLYPRWKLCSNKQSGSTDWLG